VRRPWSATSRARRIVGGIDQVSQAIVGMDEVTQQNVALVQHDAASAAPMGNQAQRLAGVVANF
jgi:methyl-accepting chemotaxis protein